MSTVSARARLSSRGLVAAAAATTVSTWASAFVVIRHVGRQFSPGPLSLLRIGVAAIVLTLAMLVRRERRPGPGHLSGVVLCGIAWFGFYNLALNEGERRIDAGTAAMVVYLGPVLIAVLAGWLLKEGFPRRLLAGCFVSLMGVVLIGVSNSGDTGDPLGVILCLGAAILYAIGVVAQKPALAHSSSLSVTWLACVAGTAVCLPFLPGLVHELATATTGAILGGLYLGVIPTALAFTTWAFALSRSTAGRMGGISYLVPALAVLMGWIFLGEVPSALAILGGGVVIAGVILGLQRPSATR